MNFRLTAILFGIVLLLVVGLLVSTLVDDKPATDAVLLAALDGQKPADIDIIEIVRSEPEEKLVMVRTGKDRWELREPSPGRVDASLVNRIITELLKLKPTISKDLTGDPALHGLDKPGVKVTLRAGSTKSATLNIGDTTIGGDKAVTFVATGERPGTPLAVKRGDLTDLFKDTVKDGKSAALTHTLSEFRLKRLLGVDIFNAIDGAKGLNIKAGGKEMTLSHVGADWKFEQPAGYGLVDIAGDSTPAANAITFTGLRSLFATLSSLAVNSPEDFIENPEAPEKYGLAANDPNLIRIELIPKEGPPDVVLIGKRIDGPGLTKYYAQVPGEKCVVKVTAERL